MSKQDAVKQAVAAELERLQEAVPLTEQLKAFWEKNPLPPATGLSADKAFFDELSGGL